MKISKPRITRKKILLLIVALIIVSLIIIVRLINTPSVGIVSTPNPSPSKEALPVYYNLAGEYISSSYSSVFTLSDNDQASASLEHWILLARSQANFGQSDKIAIFVTKLSAGGLNDESEMRLFNAHPELYEKHNVTVNNEPAIAADRTDGGYEHTVLWPHGQYLLTMSLSASGKNQNILDEFNYILGKVKWLK